MSRFPRPLTRGVFAQPELEPETGVTPTAHHKNNRVVEDSPDGGQIRMTDRSLAAIGGGPNAANPLLEIADVTMRFGGIVALEAVTFSISQGRIVGLIGPNGAGKTTLFNCLSRLYRPNARRYPSERPLAQPLRAIGHRRPWRRAHFPGPDAVCIDVGTRQRQGRRACARATYSPDRRAVVAAHAARRARVEQTAHSDAGIRRPGPHGGAAGGKSVVGCAQARRAGARVGRSAVACFCSTNRPAG